MSPATEPGVPSRVVLPFVLVPDWVEAALEQDTEVIAPVRQVELARIDLLKLGSFVASTPR